MHVPGVSEPVLVVLRVVLYAADQPEDRCVLVMNLSGCRSPCSHYPVVKDHAAGTGPRSEARDVLELFDLQLDAVEALEDGAGAAWLTEIEGEFSIVPIIAALAAVHGLGTGPCCVFKIFGFDLLHVRFYVSLFVGACVLDAPRFESSEWRRPVLS